MTEQSTHRRTELAYRSSGGIDVTLFWSPARGSDHEDEVVVHVRDRRDWASFEILAEPHLALDVYYHPYAYRDVGAVDHRDTRLAA
jgi:hypothetical protein